MVVAQLVEQLLLSPEVCGSNPVIGKLYNTYTYTVNCIEKTKIKKKGREWPIKKLLALLNCSFATPTYVGR